VSSKLSTTNPYLRDPVVRARTVFTSVASSSAIEGILAPFRQMANVASRSGLAAADESKLDSNVPLIPVKL
jgi:hypothetical protein